MTMPRSPRPEHAHGRAGGALALVTGAAVLFGALAGCGSSAPATPPSSASTSSASSSAGSPSSASPSAAGSTSAASSDAPTPTTGGAPTGSGSLATPTIVPGGPATLTGTIEAGVESGCLVLTGSDGAVLANLIGLDASTAPTGVPIEVSGRFATDMMTTCQQGKPFSVAEVVEK